MPKKLGRIALPILAAAALLAAPPSRAATTLTIGYGSAGDFLPLLVAKEKSFLTQHGLDATLTVVTAP